jgi:hypothetical protein
MAKVYNVEIRWLYKGRYDKVIESRYTASSIRAAIGKALGEKREGWRERQYNVLNITATVLATQVDKNEAVEIVEEV